MTRPRIVILVVACCLAVALLYFFRFSPSARQARHLSRGDRYFQAGEFEKAKLEYFNVVRADASNKLAVERLGLIWLNQGAPAQAIPYLGRARQLTPSDVDARLRLGRATQALGDFRSGFKESLAVLEQAPQNDDAWILAADTAVAKEDVALLTEKLSRATPMSAAQHYAAGVLAMKKPHLGDAEKHLQECLAKDPRLARAHLRLADVALLQRNREKAGEAIKAAFSIAPPRTLEKLRYPQFLMEMGKVDEARAMLDSVVRENPDYLPASILSARIAAAEKKHAEGLAALENVFSRDPGNAEARLLQAQLHLAKGDLPAAIEHLERLTKAFPKGILPRLELGRAYALAKRPGEAADQLRHALALNPDFPEAQTLLAELDLRAGHPQPVVDALRRLLAKHPTSARAQLLLADAHRMLKQYDEAAAIYRGQAQAAPQNSTPLLFLGTVQREQGKVDEARDTFEKAAQLDPNNFSVLNNLVDLDLARKDYASAQARLAKLDEKNRASAAARVTEARILGAQKLWEPAEAALLQAIQAEPDSGPAYQLLVSLYYETGRIAEAVQRLQEKLGRTPGDAASGMLLARLHEEQNNAPAARAAYEAVLVRRPDSVVALNNLAYLLAVKLNEKDRPLELGRKARSLDPNSPFVADTLGWILYTTGDYDGALGLVQESAAKLAEKGTVPGEVSFHLGMACSAMGRIEAAKVALTKAAEDPAQFAAKASIPVRLQLLDYDPASPALPFAGLEALAKENPADPLVHLRLGEALETEGKTPAAAAAYEQALKVNPKLALAAARLAQLLSRDPASSAQALEYAKSARTLAPSDRQVAEILGTAAARLGDVQWSYSLLQQAVTPSTAPAASIFEFAIVAFRMGKAKEARQTLERASAASPPAELAARIQFYRRMLDASENPAAAGQAHAEIEEGRKGRATRLPAEMAHALVLEDKGDLAGAAAIYEGILRSEPAFPLAKARLAAVLLRQGASWERAHELATAARALVPDEPISAAVLGETSFRKKEFSRAVDLLKEARGARPLDAKQLYFLGVALFELKQREESKTVLQAAVDSKLDGPELGHAQSLLAELSK